MNINKMRSLISDAEAKRLEDNYNNEFVKAMKGKIVDMHSTPKYKAQKMGDWLDRRLYNAMEYVAFLKNKIEQLEEGQNE